MAIDQPQVSRGVLVDAGGYFLGAFQWAAGSPAPDFGSPSKTGLYFLTEAEALDPPSEKARWNFSTKVWELPTTRLWIVEQKTGRCTGGGLFWLERLKPLPPGKIYVDIEPPKERGRVALWDDEDQTWKFPRVVFAGNATTGICENVILEQPQISAPPFDPPGLARLGDDRNGHPRDAVHDAPVGIGCIKRSDGKWRALHDDRATKGDIAAALGRAGLTAAFTTYLTDRGLQSAWNEASTGAEFPVLSAYVSEFLVAQGLTADEILTVVDDATGTPTPP